MICLFNRSRITCLIAGMMWLLLACTHQSAFAFGTNYAACSPCGYKTLVWSDGEFDQVHLVSASSAPGNLHPHTLSVEGLTKALTLLQHKSVAGVVPLLDSDGAARLAHGIASSLAKATPQQEALFLVTSGGATGLFTTKVGSSGRAFIDANGLNIVFGEVNVDFVSQYRGTRRARPFEFGSRSQASMVTLTSDNWSQPRNDWVTVPLAAINGQDSPRTRARGTGEASTSMPAAHDEQYYSAQETRLKGLKRLRDQNLISEEEYQAKRGEILKAW